MLELLKNLSNGDMQSWWLLFVTVCSAAAMQILSVHKEFDGSKYFLSRFFPEATDTTIFRIDFFLMIFVGTFIGFIVFTPENDLEALGAGMGWVGVLNVLASPKRPSTL